MRSIIRSYIRHRRAVLVFFAVAVLVSALASLRVRINYNLQDYLPRDVPSTTAAERLSEAFGSSIPNVRVSVPVEGVADALAWKARLAAVDGVHELLWLDDAADIHMPLETLDQTLVEGFWNGERALYQLSADAGDAAGVLARLQALDPEAHVAGHLVDIANAQNAAQREVLQITAILVPLALMILLLTTHAWLEPLCSLLAIGVGVILNMGTNLFLGEISFITQSVGAVLQLAVSMDYAIFLLNRFNALRREGYEAEEAMARAVRQALTAIASSGLTTMLGFLALIFMRFRLGGDLGIVMAKGIVFSFLAVMVFMPALILSVYRLIDRSRHRALLPDFRFLGRFVAGGRGILLVLVLIIAVPAFLGSRSNAFIYGAGAYPAGSRSERDHAAMLADFGEQTQMALMVPRGDVPRELALQRELEGLASVRSVISYVANVDPTIPPELLDPEQIASLLAPEHALFLITVATPGEGELAFAAAQAVRDSAARHYGADYQLAGNSVSMLDMKHTVEADEIVVNGLAIIAIALTIMLAYRSLSLPLILVLTIEIAIWINLSVPYFTGSRLSYIGYLIISTVQLGATVDYAIIYTHHYLDHRRQRTKREATIESIREVVPSLLPPALILTCTGIVMSRISTMAVVSELGAVLGRGAALSFALVILFLPGLLRLLDPILPRTSLGLRFYEDRRRLRRTTKEIEP